MKIWRDANEIGMIHELPNEKLKEIDVEMRKKPNFDKYQKGEKGCCKNEKKEKTSKTNKREKKSTRHRRLYKI